MVQGVCDELIEFRGEREIVWSRQWDLVGSRQGGEGEKKAYGREQHVQCGFALGGEINVRLENKTEGPSLSTMGLFASADTLYVISLFGHRAQSRLTLAKSAQRAMECMEMIPCIPQTIGEGDIGSPLQLVLKYN